VTTPAPDVVIAAYQALGEEEREVAFERIRQLRVADAAAGETDMARHLRSLARVAEEVGRVPTVTEYRVVAPRLAAAGEAVTTFTAVYDFFGSWPRAREALELAGAQTPQLIEARFRFREMGKVWRYTDDTLRDALMRAAEYWDRPPSVAEFEWWREQEQRRLQATGDTDPYLPSTSPYRKRWGTWEAALLHFGFSREDVALRLEGKTQPHNRNADPFLPEGLPIASLAAADDPASLPLADEQVIRLRDAYDNLPRRSRYVLTVRLGLGVPARTLKAAAEPLALSLDRIRQLQLASTDALAEAVAGDDPVTEARRGAVVETLRRLTGATA
jgi:hypothetical protein